MLEGILLPHIVVAGSQLPDEVGVISPLHINQIRTDVEDLTATADPEADVDNTDPEAGATQAGEQPIDLMLLASLDDWCGNGSLGGADEVVCCR
jgi:hypothetical protein